MPSQSQGCEYIKYAATPERNTRSYTLRRCNCDKRRLFCICWNCRQQYIGCIAPSVPPMLAQHHGAGRLLRRQGMTVGEVLRCDARGCGGHCGCRLAAGQRCSTNACGPRRVALLGEALRSAEVWRIGACVGRSSFDLSQLHRRSVSMTRYSSRNNRGMSTAYVFTASLTFWLGIMLTTQGFGWLAFAILAALSAALHTTGVVAWPWAWVTLPLSASIGAVIATLWILSPGRHSGTASQSARLGAIRLKRMPPSPDKWRSEPSNWTRAMLWGSRSPVTIGPIICATRPARSPSSMKL